MSYTTSPMIMNNDRKVIQIRKFILASILQHSLPSSFLNFILSLQNLCRWKYRYFSKVSRFLIFFFFFKLGDTTNYSARTILIFFSIVDAMINLNMFVYFKFILDQLLFNFKVFPSFARCFFGTAYEKIVPSWSIFHLYLFWEYVIWIQKIIFDSFNTCFQMFKVFLNIVYFSF